MAKRRKLTKADRFYIEQHATSMTVDQLAEDLNLAAATVQEVLDELPKPAKKQKPKKLANFETGKGIVAMTGDQAMDDDAATGNSPFQPAKTKPKRNDAFYKEHRKNLHKIRPNEPFQ